MVVQTRRSQIAAFALSLLFILGLGVLSYLFIKRGGGGTEDTARYLGETVLFISIVCASVIAVLFGFIFIRNRNVLRELDKVIEMSMYNNYSPLQSLSRLSVIGDKIGTIYRNLSILSEKRALKISSLHNLNTFLIDFLPFPAAVLDIQGTVIYTSREMREGYEVLKTSEAVSITALFSDLNFQNVIHQLKENISFVEETVGRSTLTFHPVRNRNLEISNIVCTLGRVTLSAPEPAVHKVKQQKTGDVTGGLLARMFKRVSGRER